MNIKAVYLTTWALFFLKPEMVKAQVNRFYQSPPANQYQMQLYSPDYSTLLGALEARRIAQQAQEERERQLELQRLKNQYAGKVHLFGGRNHDVYLGCLNCSPEDELSIWNRYGKFGLGKTGNNIWDQFSIYGGQSDCSPWGLFSSYPPVIVNFDGEFYGYFTANTSKEGRTYYDAYRYLSEHYNDVIILYDDFGGIFR